ncbi:MAG: PEGA domain-containing protein [Deltaproteobacteria bacterium]|nr:MAG: PEGA domain-containing protein [Deltaproteobacteria bacterium]
MKFTCGRRSRVALVLCVAMAMQWATPWPSSAKEILPEPALLLRFAGSDIPPGEAKAYLGMIPGAFSGAVRVRWVPVPADPDPGEGEEREFPVPDDAALRAISETIATASIHMDKVEDAAAARVLGEAEGLVRRYRFTDATRPFLAEIFLRAGILKIREGDAGGAEKLLARSRALRPGFSPDPALFPPQVLAAWEGARGRPLPEADLLVQSLPSGASIFVDGDPRGTTPSRVRPGKTGPVRIRISHPGYKDAERSGQWLPGDSETIGFTLSGDRVARLGELLADVSRRSGEGTGPLVSEIARAAGVSRVALLAFERRPDGFEARIYSGGAGGADPVLLGVERFPANAGDAIASWASSKLLAAGWPGERDEAGAKPWYNKIWFWTVVLSAVGLAAALGGGGGGGGSGGSSSGAVTVNF